MKNDKKITSFLGQGWSFPPTFLIEKKGVVMASEIEDINQSLKILFNTRIGERLLDPKYGCDIQDLTFESISLSLISRLKLMIEDAIAFYESRIKLIGLEVEPVQNEGKLNITISYEVRTTNSRYNYVYPFYINEGTEL